MIVLILPPLMLTFLYRSARVVQITYEWETIMNLKTFFSGVLALTAVSAFADEGTMMVKVGGEELIAYQSKPMTNPKGGDKFFGSDFIHPLKTPSGFVVTGMQPDDHLHHFGLWWPWKYVEIDGRKILCWELQQGDGIIRAQGGELTPDGFTSKSVYVDRKNKDGERTIINETVNAKVSKIYETPAKGYNLDIEIVHETAIDVPITVTTYRYSGFCLRGTEEWNKDNSTVITSEGKDYSKSNFTRAKWVRIQGDAGNGRSAGVLMMSNPGNRDFPELLRTWDPKTHNGSVFVNFNTVEEKPWVFEPGKKYTRNFRVFVYDGELSLEDAEELWKEYSKGVK